MADTDPFSVPMVFFRTGWMDDYRGLGSGDEIVGGGDFVAEHGYGHEIFNFQPFNGRMYGYVRPVLGKGEMIHGAGIRIDRIATPTDPDFIDRVLVFWVARFPEGGNGVVGWYRNATVYREWQPPPENSGRVYQGEEFGYYATTNSENAYLVPTDERVFHLPPRNDGGMGQSNVWYADDTDVHRQFRLDVLDYVTSRKPKPKPKTGGGRQPDPTKRLQVERAAESVVWKHYAELGYELEDVTDQHVGWDFTATLRHRRLRIEVKGLSGEEICVEVTPNEYAKMMEHKDSYRLCVVTDALGKPTLSVFFYSAESGDWKEQGGERVLTINEIVAARCTGEERAYGDRTRDSTRESCDARRKRIVR